MCKITITKQVENPNYAEELEKFKADNRVYFSGNGVEGANRPDKHVEKSALYFVATEEQFEVIRKAALETFK